MHFWALADFSCFEAQLRPRCPSSQSIVLSPPLFAQLSFLIWVPSSWYCVLSGGVQSSSCPSAATHPSSTPKFMPLFCFLLHFSSSFPVFLHFCLGYSVIYLFHAATPRFPELWWRHLISSLDFRTTWRWSCSISPVQSSCLGPFRITKCQPLCNYLTLTLYRLPAFCLRLNEHHPVLVTTRGMKKLHLVRPNGEVL
jgi:hypothetical protein